MKIEINVKFDEVQKKEIIEKCMEMLNTTDSKILNIHIIWTEEQKEKMISFLEEKFNEELEKIKARIMELQTNLCFEDEEKYSEQIKGMTETINIINESISELKEQ